MPKPRAVLYARYSTDLQRDQSIEDQLRICRQRAEAAGWAIVDSYTDHAVSGASLLRPGIQRLLRDATENRFDIVLSEALDRLSRDQKDIAHIFKALSFRDIRLVTLSEGDIDEMHIGLKGTMNSLYIKELSRKTHRGLEGRALQGKSAGGKSYGYDVRRSLTAEGALKTGERDINQAEADIVRRIFADYAVGKSPRKIALELNKKGIEGPSGKAWSASTINGNRQRGTGILNNELYIGRQVWNRLRYVKDPATGKRVSRLNPEAEWVITDVPDLRIISDDVWDNVKAYQASLDKRESFRRKKRPPNLLSYMLKCGKCGGGMSIVSSKRYGCSTARNKGTCDNRTTIGQDELEQRVLGALRNRLMNPELTKTFCQAYAKRLNEQRMEHNATLDHHRRELEKTELRIKQIVQAIGDGIDVSLIKDEANGLQAKKEKLIALTANVEEAPIYVHPRMAERYAQSIRNLLETMNDPDHRDESAKILRELIDKIVLTPSEDKKSLIVDLHGDLAGILQMSESDGSKLQIIKSDALDLDRQIEIEKVTTLSKTLDTQGLWDSKVQMVAGAGFEPATFRL